MTLPAGMDVLLDAPQRIRQRQSLSAVGRQKKVRQPFGGLRPDPRQLAQLLHELAYRSAKFACHKAPDHAPGSGSPGNPMPVGSPRADVIFAVSSAVNCRALSRAWLTAPLMRSSSSSRSFCRSASSLIEHESNSSLPLTRTRTMPPPAFPSALN